MSPPTEPMHSPSENRDETLRAALSELEDSRRRLDAARTELDDPKLVAEMERLVAERGSVVDRLLGSAWASRFTDASQEVARPRSRGSADSTSTTSQREETTDVQAAVIERLIRRETATIGALRRSLERSLPQSIETSLRRALTQVGRTRDQLQLVSR